MGFQVRGPTLAAGARTRRQGKTGFSSRVSPGEAVLAQRRSGQRCIHGKRVISGHHTLGKLDQQRPYPQAREGVVRDLTRAGSRSDVKARGFKVRAINSLRINVAHARTLAATTISMTDAHYI